MENAGSRLKLHLAGEVLAICRLGRGGSSMPEWLGKSGFYSVTHTEDELSLVCPQIQVPEGIRKEGGWRCLKVEGPLDFSLTGVLASLTAPLAIAEISVFAISTFDTDYLLVKEDRLEEAIDALTRSGFEVVTPVQ